MFKYIVIYNTMIKDKSIKIIAMVSKKIILQKKILKYQEIIEDIDEYLDENLESSRNISAFQNIFNKLTEIRKIRHMRHTGRCQLYFCFCL